MVETKKEEKLVGMFITVKESTKKWLNVEKYQRGFKNLGKLIDVIVAEARSK